MNERECLVFLSFFFLSFLIILLLFLHFRFPRCHSFFYSIPIKIFLSLLLLLLNHLFLFITFFLFVIRFFLLFISLSCLIPFFQSFVFANFSISFIWNVVPLWYRCLFRFTFRLYYSAFSISQSCYLVCSLFHSFKTCNHSHREIRTNMHDKGTKRNAGANEPSLC